MPRILVLGGLTVLVALLLILSAKSIAQSEDQPQNATENTTVAPAVVRTHITGVSDSVSQGSSLTVRYFESEQEEQPTFRKKRKKKTKEEEMVEEEKPEELKKMTFTLTRDTKYMKGMIIVSSNELTENKGITVFFSEDEENPGSFRANTIKFEQE